MLNYLSLYSSPLDQFEIIDILSVNTPYLANLHFSLSNIGFYLIITFFLGVYLNILGINYNKVFANT